MSAIVARLGLNNRASRRWPVPSLLIILLYLLPQLFGGGAFRMGEYEEVLSFLSIAVALNIAMGYGGQYILGITAVFAVGAYAAVLAAKYHPADIGLVAMCVITAIAGAIRGLIIRRSALPVAGFSLALVSLFAAMAIPTVATQWNF